MLGTFARFTRQVRRPALAAVAISTLVLPAFTTPSVARGPDGIADIAEQVIDAVVNISTSQKVEARNTPMPNLPNDPQLDELFRDFFNRRGQGDNNQNRGNTPPRRVNSLGSGFIIDAAGIVVTNNHVIADADEITVILNDGSRIKAELIGTDKKIDIALLRIKPDRPLKAVKFGDSERLRLGEWVIAIGNPFSLGGTVTAGIVSARNRDINSGPYDNYIQTDAAINRGNSGGPLFNLEGEVVGINTAIISPSGGSIGIGFAVPSKTALAVIDQLKQFGETRRGWLGVRIQQVTDEIAESLGIKPAHGALVKEESKTVTLGRLEDGEKQAALTTPADPGPAPVVKKTLGLELAGMSDDLRKKYKIKDTVKGIVILGVDAASAAADKRLNAGDVIVEVAQEAVASADEFLAKIDKLKKDGRRTALLLVAGTDGELRFVALALQ